MFQWHFRPTTPKEKLESGETPQEEKHNVAVYSGPPRVLEIGCSDGKWCFKVKQEQPDWIIEGIDDSDHWSCVQKDIEIRCVKLITC